MRHIYTSVDIGSDTIKVVVCELYRGRYNLLATSTVKSQGIKKGLITDIALAKNSVKQAFEQIESMLGIKLKKVIAIIPSYFADFTMITGEVKTSNNIVTGPDVVNVLQAAMQQAIIPSKEMVTILPIDFTLDNEITKEPINKQSSSLKTRAIMVTTPKKNIYSVISLFNSMGVEVVDISLGCIGDIYTFKDENIDKNVTALVNIGEEKTEVSLYNKGIIVKHSIINIGSKSIDNDIAYMYKIDASLARELKEKFAMASKTSSSLNEIREIKNKFDEIKKINQYEVSEIASSRIDEILSLVNQEINSLSKHKPEFIYITGGLTNMTKFESICREKLGKCAIIGNVNLIGLRNNKFSSAIGNIIYFVNKLKLKGKDYSMISSEDMENLSTPRKNSSNDTMFGKVFEYFFGE